MIINSNQKKLLKNRSTLLTRYLCRIKKVGALNKRIATIQPTSTFFNSLLTGLLITLE